MESDEDYARDDEARDGEVLLAEFKDLAANQSSQAERISGRALQGIAFVGALFAIIQAAALTPSTVPGSVVGVGIAAAGALAVTGLFGLISTMLHDYPAVGAQDIERAHDTAVENDEDLAFRLSKLYKAQVIQGSGVLKAKREFLLVSQLAGMIAVVLLVVEAVLALTAHS